MTKKLIIRQPLVFVSDGTVLANSQQIATHFKKRHDNVLRDIDTLLSSEECPPDFFHLATYTADNGQTYRSYNMTRDGLALLAMGFTGDDALKFKVDFINAFNTMESTLKETKVRKLAPVRMSGVLMKELRETMQWMSEEFNMSPASKQALAADLYAPLGIHLGAPPVERTWQTSDIASNYGQHPIPFGKKVTPLKTAENGEFRLTTAANGKQVSIWVWNKTGRDAIQNLFNSQTN